VAFAAGAIFLGLVAMDLDEEVIAVVALDPAAELPCGK
jgi:hypothetical protein